MSDLSKDMDGNQGQRGGQGEGRRDQKPTELQSDLDGEQAPKIAPTQSKQIAAPQTIRDDAQEPVKKSSTRDEKENDVPSITSAFDAATLKKQTVPQLKDILRERGLKLSGKKAELIERINSSL
ncbi:hypothetical protein FRACYDRAFT_268349 [Fragilariopsis cylindrus CCMP1102]|uniref:SAP domain-containing protein n=1 Tax=Fragilariopsis cylindrus CCMP1102 TaxID=635003 RepID=A0A1E7FK92_9STRA|nr:hypothetical protein FRACYDRAFT_268349 [Fragilariopsis cylindrus CCMP1102]|eukprot:OEU18557.1 hypothetical protein FRACYDRAFT_268349 [Fragilariopsis cylindrus CCMP1102]